MPSGADFRPQGANESPGPIRPFTPPDLSSIPNMDGTPLQLMGTSGASNSNNNGLPGPYIVGSPIDLGQIDNVDNMGSHMQDFVPTWCGKRMDDHIELKETGAPPSGDAGNAECDFR